MSSSCSTTLVLSSMEVSPWEWWAALTAGAGGGLPYMSSSALALSLASFSCYSALCKKSPMASHSAIVEGTTGSLSNLSSVAFADSLGAFAASSLLWRCFFMSCFCSDENVVAGAFLAAAKLIGSECCIANKLPIFYKASPTAFLANFGAYTASIFEWRFISSTSFWVIS